MYVCAGLDKLFKPVIYLIFNADYGGYLNLIAHRLQIHGEFFVCCYLVFEFTDCHLVVVSRMALDFDFN